MRIPAHNGPSIRRIACIAAACSASWLAAAPAFAQEPLTGVSHPDNSVITADPDTALPASTVPAMKPSAAKPATEVYGPYVPYRAPGAATPATTPSVSAYDPDANVVTAETAGNADRHLLSGVNDSKDPDAGIVTSVPSRSGEIGEGTLLKAKLNETISTVTTTAGTKFSASISEPLMKDGKVIVPSGSLLEGRVTWVRGGKRIGGAAAIHLEPRSITLPDGGQYMIRAQVIDTDNWNNTKVDEEGTVVRKDHGKQTLGVMSLAAAGPMAAGAMLGGVPGALIGAGVGAGVGTVIWLKQDRQAELPKDLGLVFSLTEPMSVTPMGMAAAPTLTGAVTGRQATVAGD